MRRIAHAAALIAATLATASAPAPARAEAPGLRLLELDMDHHPEPVRAALWYPAEALGRPETVFANPLFAGLEARPGAPVAGGRHPAVLLSHGLGGGVESVGWLAAAFAERGAVVVAVSHPGSTWRDFDAARAARHWSRAEDMSAALDAVLADPALAGRLDEGRVMAAGFSFGGWTALSLGGARSDREGFEAACRAQAHAGCALFLGSMPATRDWEAGRRDGRVTHVAAIDPGLVWGLTAEGVAGLEVPVLLVGLGEGADRLPAADFDASGLLGLLPEAEVVRLAPASHFTAMPLCTDGAEGILEAEGDDPVCTEPAGGERAGVHAAMVEALAVMLGL